ncbi:MAG: YhdH/YhfP family quinone oxidoreductase [Spirochaetales bacterium]|nr:YhdH/YhfP family quinone oxidoreductase [Spirochaetales bacterium]
MKKGTHSMEPKKYLAYVIEEKDGTYTRELQTRDIEELPPGELLVEVHYTSVNYKDALSATGNKGVTKEYPHTPGIDAAGVVVSSDSEDFNENDEVIVTSYDLGMNTAGGFGQYIRVPAEWAVRLPEGLSLKEAMVIGTAGLTAAISVLRLFEKVTPDQGPIGVSGATGGVGSMAISILSRLGYEVSAITGKEEEEDYLRRIGADRIVNRREFSEKSKRPLLKSAFAGTIDTVGGLILENLIKSTKPQGIVTCCGNAASAELNLTVYPFILRGVSLAGVDSQNYPITERDALWRQLAEQWKPLPMLDEYREIGFHELDEVIDSLLAGRGKGRTVLDLRRK